MDPHRQTDDPDHPSARHHPPGPIQRVARQRHDLAAARQPSTAGGQGLLHVPSQHQPDDQPSRIPAGCW